MIEKNMQELDAVVLAAGAWPGHAVPMALLDHRRVVCCDSAAEAFVASGRVPMAVVGDGDSISGTLRQQVNFVHIADQETNDLTKAVHYLRETMAAGGRPLRIAIIGATGRREDHALGNISLLVDYLRMGVEATMLTDHGAFVPCRGTRTMTAADEWWMGDAAQAGLEGRPVSLFNFTCTRLSAEGLQYPLRAFDAWWQGTLNRVAAASFTVEADNEYLVYLPYVQ